MKTIKWITAIVLGLTINACTGQSQTQDRTSNGSVSKIEVLDFHSTHRCMTCNAIETNTRYTLNTYFVEELAAEKITMQVINVDEKENEAIAEKFEAAGTALFLNVIKNGEETQIDLTEFAFMNGNEQEVFSTELKAKIDLQLKTL